MLTYNSRTRVDNIIFGIDMLVFESDGHTSLDEFRLIITQVLTDAAHGDVLYQCGCANYNFWPQTDLICMIADELITHSYEST